VLLKSLLEKEIFQVGFYLLPEYFREYFRENLGNCDASILSLPRNTDVILHFPLSQVLRALSGDMPTIIDTLITEYRAQDNATSAVDRIARATDRLHNTIRNVVAGLAALNIAQRVLAIGNEATAAASEFASLQARLEALTNSAERTKRILKTAVDVAAPSPFTTRQLANAAVTLEAFGANSERILPILGRLGAAMGATDQSIEVFTRAFGQLATGKMIESDVLASMGLSKRDFAQQGIKFDGQGQLQSSAVETLTALETIVLQRFGGILTKMADTPEAKRASLQDAGEKTLRIIGDGLLRASAPFMESATKVLTGLADSGVLNEVTQKITGAFLAGFGGDKTEEVARFAANILAFLYDLPGRVKTVYDYISTLASAVVNNIAKAFGFLTESVKNLFTGKALPGVPQFATLPSINKMMEGLQGTNRADEFFQRIMAGANAPSNELPDNRNQSFLTRQQDALEAIADSTDRTARNTDKPDVQRLLFGGGDRAAAGVSLLDLYPRTSPSFGARPTPKIEVRVGSAASLMERAVLEILRATLPTIQRNLGAMGSVQ
jgi:hypothetical protein